MFLFHFFDLTETPETGGGKGEGSVYGGQQTGVIESKPAVKIQSASVDPGIGTTPRSVVQVPTVTDDQPTVSGGVSVDVSILPTTSHVPNDEEVNDSLTSSSSGFVLLGEGRRIGV